MKRMILVAIMILVAVSAQASGLLLTCDVGGAKLEQYDETTKTWKNVGGLPHLFAVEQYDYVLVRVSADGYTELEQGFDVRDPGTVRINMTLEREESNPDATPLFAIGGQVTSKRGLSIFAGMYTLMVRNMATYVSGAGQRSQDYNAIQSGGTFTLTLADLTFNRAAAVGDKIFVGVFNSSKSQCYAYAYITLTQEDISNGCKIVDLQVK